MDSLNPQDQSSGQIEIKDFQQQINLDNNELYQEYEIMQDQNKLYANVLDQLGEHKIILLNLKCYSKMSSSHSLDKFFRYDNRINSDGIRDQSISLRPQQNSSQLLKNRQIFIFPDSVDEINKNDGKKNTWKNKFQFNKSKTLKETEKETYKIQNNVRRKSCHCTRCGKLTEKEISNFHLKMIFPKRHINISTNQFMKNIIKPSINSFTTTKPDSQDGSKPIININSTNNNSGKNLLLSPGRVKKPKQKSVNVSSKDSNNINNFINNGNSSSQLTALQQYTRRKKTYVKQNSPNNKDLSNKSSPNKNTNMQFLQPQQQQKDQVQQEEDQPQIVLNIARDKKLSIRFDKEEKQNRISNLRIDLSSITQKYNMDDSNNNKQNQKQRQSKDIKRASRKCPTDKEKAPHLVGLLYSGVQKLQAKEGQSQEKGKLQQGKVSVNKNRLYIDQINGGQRSNKGVVEYVQHKLQNENQFLQESTERRRRQSKFKTQLPADFLNMENNTPRQLQNSSQRELTKKNYKEILKKQCKQINMEMGVIDKLKKIKEQQQQLQQKQQELQQEKTPQKKKQQQIPKLVISPPSSKTKMQQQQQNSKSSRRKKNSSNHHNNSNNISTSQENNNNKNNNNNNGIFGNNMSSPNKKIDQQLQQQQSNLSSPVQIFTPVRGSQLGKRVSQFSSNIFQYLQQSENKLNSNGNNNSNPIINEDNNNNDNYDDDKLIEFKHQILEQQSSDPISNNNKANDNNNFGTNNTNTNTNNSSNNVQIDSNDNNNYLSDNSSSKNQIQIIGQKEYFGKDSYMQQPLTQKSAVGHLKSFFSPKNKEKYGTIPKLKYFSSINFFSNNSKKHSSKQHSSNNGNNRQKSHTSRNPHGSSNQLNPCYSPRNIKSQQQPMTCRSAKNTIRGKQFFSTQYSGGFSPKNSVQQQQQKLAFNTFYRKKSQGDYNLQINKIQQEIQDLQLQKSQINQNIQTMAQSAQNFKSKNLGRSVQNSPMKKTTHTNFHYGSGESINGYSNNNKQAKKIKHIRINKMQQKLFLSYNNSYQQNNSQVNSSNNQVCKQ